MNIPLEGAQTVGHPCAGLRCESVQLESAKRFNLRVDLVGPE